MLAQNMKYRSIFIAYLYVPPRTLTQEQAAQIYLQLGTRISREFQLQYIPEKSEESFKILMQKKDGRHLDRITVDIINKQTLRMLVEQYWPESLDLACRNADEIKKIFTPIIPDEGIQLIEVRLRAQTTGAGKRKAFEDITEKFMGKNKNNLNELGNIKHLGVKFVIEDLNEALPLVGVMREVSVEPLKEDENAIYIEIMSQWGKTAAKPTESGLQLIPGPLSVEILSSSEYIKENQKYIETTLCKFLEV